MARSLIFAADRFAMELEAGAGFCGGGSEEAEDEEYEYVDEEIEEEEEIEVEIEEEVEPVAEAGERPYEDKEAMEKSNENEDNVEQMEAEVGEVAREAKRRRLCEDGSSLSSSAHNPRPSSSANIGRSSHTSITPSSPTPGVGLSIEGRSSSQNAEKTKKRVLESAGASANDPQAQASKSKSKKSSKDVHEGSTEELKRFKAAVAEFCKKVINPAWHSGQLSLDAFRSIVKESLLEVMATLIEDKVPGTAKEVNEYIDSNREELDMIVQGYLNVYLKSANGKAVA